jgi:hypothetical protein
MLRPNDGPPVESPQIWLLLPLQIELHANVLVVRLIVFPQIQNEVPLYLQNKEVFKKLNTSISYNHGP